MGISSLIWNSKISILTLSQVSWSNQAALLSSCDPYLLDCIYWISDSFICSESDDVFISSNLCFFCSSSFEVLISTFDQRFYCPSDTLHWSSFDLRFWFWLFVMNDLVFSFDASRHEQFTIKNFKFSSKFDYTNSSENRFRKHAAWTDNDKG